ncbi:MAG: four helix bundle protein [Candidatus Omnitrophica bacterium]|jgi:four helix bundle protein|nr:four helix bundle protein [Candidatus Omnitrophota bacterium]
MREKIICFEDLKVWQKSHELTLLVYKITKDFPGDEKFCLVSQMRRAAVSVSANIAEGFKRRGKKDKINFYNISQGSLTELYNYMILGKDLDYIDRRIFEQIKPHFDQIGKMLNGLISTTELALHSTY